MVGVVLTGDDAARLAIGGLGVAALLAAAHEASRVLLCVLAALLLVAPLVTGPRSSGRQRVASGPSAVGG